MDAKVLAPKFQEKNVPLKVGFGGYDLNSRRSYQLIMKQLVCNTIVRFLSRLFPDFPAIRLGKITVL
jgi:hypothetical protein